MANNTFTKTYVDGLALFEAELDTALQTLQPDLAQTVQLADGSTSGQFLKSQGTGSPAVFASVPDPKGMEIRNYGLSASTSSGALVVALKTSAGADPSGTDVVDFAFSSAGSGSAVTTSIAVNTSKSITINSSATLGVTSTSTMTVYVYAINVAGAVKMAVSNCGNFDRGDLITTLAMSAAADTQDGLYATAALSVVPRLLGFIQTTHTAAGVWQSPSRVGLFNAGSGVPRTVVSGTLTYSNTTSTFTTVSTIAITVRAIPIEITLEDIASTSTAAVIRSQHPSTTNNGAASFIVYRGTTCVGHMGLTVHETTTGVGYYIEVPPSSIRFVDQNPGVGSVVYKLQARSSTGGGNVNITSCRFRVRELG